MNVMKSSTKTERGNNRREGTLITSEYHFVQLKGTMKAVFVLQVTDF